ncbi:MAG: response regulator transcription factor [Verrucomicrobiota bacterium]
MQRPIKVQIVEDHPAVQIAVSQMLESKNYEIKAIHETVEEAIDYMTQSETDVNFTVLDITLPGPSGESLVRYYRKHHPEIAILIYSGTSNLDIPIRCIRHGARGFVRKASPIDEFLKAVDVVAVEGKTYIPEVLNRYKASTTSRRAKISLTSRELEVARLVTFGDSNLAIAEKLGISERTVNIHRSNMMRKIGAHNATDVTRYVIKNKLVGQRELSLNAAI